jgi:hypothetical protein
MTEGAPGYCGRVRPHPTVWHYAAATSRLATMLSQKTSASRA